MTGKARRPIFGILVIAAAGLAGCGGVSETETDPITGSEVLDATEAAKTAKFSMTMEMRAEHYSVEWTADGVVDFPDDRGTAIITMATETSPTPTSTGEFDYETFEMPTGEMRADARWIGDDAWLRLRDNVDPKRNEMWGFPTDGKWLKTSDVDDDYVDCTVGGGAGFGSDGPPTAAVRDILETLRTDGNVLEELGTEVVRGEPTTHWRVASPKLSPKCSAEDKATLEKVVVEVWTDDDERARRVLLTVDGKGFSGTEREHASFTTDLYDFGTDVEVTAPPASEVVDDDEMFSSGEGSSGESEVSITHEAEEIDYGTPGEWKVVAEGTRAGEPWRVWTTKTSTGVDCYDAENLAGQHFLPGPSPDEVTHDSRAATCVGGSVVGLPYGDFIVLAAVTDAGRLSIVGRANGDQATVVFADGSTQPMQLDPATHVAQWRGPRPEGIVKIKTNSGTCTLGTEFDGEINPTLGTDNTEFPCIGDYGTLDSGPP